MPKWLRCPRRQWATEEMAVPRRSESANAFLSWTSQIWASDVLKRVITIDHNCMPPVAFMNWWHFTTKNKNTKTHKSKNQETKHTTTAINRSENHPKTEQYSYSWMGFHPPGVPFLAHASFGLMTWIHPGLFSIFVSWSTITAAVSVHSSWESLQAELRSGPSAPPRHCAIGNASTPSVLGLLFSLSPWCKRLQWRFCQKRFENPLWRSQVSYSPTCSPALSYILFPTSRQAENDKRTVHRLCSLQQRLHWHPDYDTPFEFSRNSSIWGPPVPTDPSRDPCWRDLSCTPECYYHQPCFDQQHHTKQTNHCHGCQFSESTIGDVWTPWLDAWVYWPYQEFQWYFYWLQTAVTPLPPKIVVPPVARTNLRHPTRFSTDFSPCHRFLHVCLSFYWPWY